jgi:hypothetical protein
MKSALTLVITLACGLHAQTTPTTVIATRVTGSQEHLSGSCSIQAVTSVSATGGERVEPVPTVVKFTNGAFTVSLIPTDTTTGPTYYRVTCTAPLQTIGGRQVGPATWGPNKWFVPTSATPVTVGTVELPGTSPGLGLTWGGAGTLTWATI